jgi:VanZ family protein
MPIQAGPAPQWSWVLLGAAVALVLGACLFPYRFELASEGTLAVVKAPERTGDTVRDVVVNVLLFLPLGVAVAAAAAERGRGGRAAMAATLAAAAGLSIGVEDLQTLLPTRDPSLRDVAANVGGAVLGHLLFLWCGAQLAALGRAVQALWRRLWLVDRPGWLLGALLIVALLSAGWLQARTRLSDWSSDFPLVVGNEATGDRPWTGWIHSFEIADRALSHRQAGAALGGSLESVLPGSLVLAQQFPDGQLPAAATAAGLGWQGQSSQPAPPSAEGLYLSGVRWLRSDEAGRSVSAALHGTNQLTLKLRCRPAGPSQVGPARIVSISTDPYRRNITVGQEGAALVVRLRTPATGPNGNEPELVRPHVFDGDGDRTILLTYDGAVLTAYVDRTEDPSRVELSPGAVLVNALASPYPLDFPGYTVLFLGLVSSPAGVLLALTFARRRTLGPGVWLSIVIFSLLLGAGLEFFLVVVSGRAPTLGPVVVGALWCSAAAVCSLWLRPR